MCPLQRPRPSPSADVGIRLPCSCPCDVGMSNLKKIHFFVNDVSNHFTYILSLLLCPVPCLHFDCSFCLET
ncbi:unnamed protein product [Staurois parvus]|uniref:Uncharacterized protein n=1 Tax=Staurois parvus TaxID=386267 RepID=A0ABN9EVE1_9NEOB|nr:unnamed protein product [Staurois parvus]